jgi:hypothetical protein
LSVAVVDDVCAVIYVADARVMPPNAAIILPTVRIDVAAFALTDGSGQPAKRAGHPVLVVQNFAVMPA